MIQRAGLALAILLVGACSSCPRRLEEGDPRIGDLGQGDSVEILFGRGSCFGLEAYALAIDGRSAWRCRVRRLYPQASGEASVPLCTQDIEAIDDAIEAFRDGSFGTSTSWLQIEASWDRDGFLVARERFRINATVEADEVTGRLFAVAHRAGWPRRAAGRPADRVRKDVQSRRLDGR